MDSINTAKQDRLAQVRQLVDELRPEACAEDIRQATRTAQLAEAVKTGIVELIRQRKNPSDHFSEIELIAGSISGYIDADKAEAILDTEDIELAREKAYEELAKLGYNATTFLRKFGLTPPQRKIDPLTPEVPHEDIQNILALINKELIRTVLVKVAGPDKLFEEDDPTTPTRVAAKTPLNERPESELRELLSVALETPENIRYAVRSLILIAAERIAHSRMKPQSELFKLKKLTQQQRAEKETEIVRRQEDFKRMCETEIPDEITAKTAENPNKLLEIFQKPSGTKDI